MSLYKSPTWVMTNQPLEGFIFRLHPIYLYQEGVSQFVEKCCLIKEVREVQLYSFPKPILNYSNLVPEQNDCDR